VTAVAAAPSRRRVAVLLDVLAHYRIDLFEALAAQLDLELRVFTCAPPSAAPRPRPRLPASFEHEHLAALRWRRRATGRTRFLPLVGPLRIASWRPDVVVAGMTTMLAVTGLAAARLASAPFVWLVDLTARVDAMLGRRWLAPLKRALARRSAVSIASSRATRDYLLHLGVRDDRIVVAPIAIDTAGFATRIEAARPAVPALRRELDLRAPVVLFCGRLERAKGVLELLERYAVAAASGAHGATLLLVGEGSLEPVLRRRAEALGVHVAFAGFRESVDLDACFAAADVFCLLSDYECFGVVVAEAAAAGLPLLVSRHAGAADHFVESGANGWVVDPAEPARVVELLARLLAEPERRREMGAASRRIALANGLAPTVEGFATAFAKSLRRT
jgi:glycosyltransferase involved in cell wall biosynthesis